MESFIRFQDEPPRKPSKDERLSKLEAQVRKLQRRVTALEDQEGAAE